MTILRNVGDGKFEVWDGEDKIAGPVSHNEGVRAVEAHNAKKAQPPAGAVDIREYERSLADSLNKERMGVGGKVAILLTKEYGADAAAMMMRQILPILKQGGKGQRRESIAVQKAANAQGKAGA